jgi:hypothetical protein
MRPSAEAGRASNLTARLNRLRKNATKRRKRFLQGPFALQDKLKPVEGKHFTSELPSYLRARKLRLPEKTLSTACKTVPGTLQMLTESI